MKESRVNMLLIGEKNELINPFLGIEDDEKESY